MLLVHNNYDKLEKPWFYLVTGYSYYTVAINIIISILQWSWSELACIPILLETSFVASIAVSDWRTSADTFNVKNICPFPACHGKFNLPAYWELY